MQPLFQTQLHSFDRTQTAHTQLFRPDRYRWLYQAVALTNSDFFIPRGQGLSFCLASAAPGSVSVSSLQFNRILAFDPDELTIDVEPGMTVGDLVHFLIAKDLWFPVIPSHPLITIGGCIALNVHGKSPVHDGLFGDHIEELSLFHPDRGEVRCGPEQNSDVFYLTVGGLGLTGYITRVRLRLQRLKGSSIVRKRIAVDGLPEAAEIMQELKEDCHQIYAVNDINAKGDRFGQGFVFLEAFAPHKIKKRYPVRRLSSSTNVALWHGMLGQTLGRYLSQIQYYGEKLRRETRQLTVPHASFPPSEFYLKICRAMKFHRCEMIIPADLWPGFTNEFARIKKENNIAIFFASLRLFSESARMLHFRQPGVCLTFDLPFRPQSLNFLQALDHLVIKHKGLPNFTCNSRLEAGVIAQCYPGYREFKQQLKNFDPKRRIYSLLRERLDV